MKSVRTLLLFCIAIAGWRTTALGQTTTSTATPQTASVNSILLACEQTMGGKGADRSFYAEGEIALAGDSSPSQHIIWKTKGRDLFRQDVTQGENTTISIVNHGHGSRTHKSVRANLPEHTTAYFRPEYIPALSCTIDRGRAGMVAEYLGQEVVAGETADHIRFTIAPNGKDKKIDDLENLISEYHIFISIVSHRVLATRTWIFSPEAVQNHSSWETFFTDYRDVNGVLMPFHIENRLNGQKVRDIVLSVVREDASISASDFQQGAAQ